MNEEFSICPRCNRKTAFTMSRYDMTNLQEDLVEVCNKCGYRSDVTTIKNINGITVKENRKWIK